MIVSIFEYFWLFYYSCQCLKGRINWEIRKSIDVCLCHFLLIIFSHEDRINILLNLINLQILIRHFKHYHKSFIANLSAIPSISKNCILYNQCNLIDQSKCLFPKNLRDLTHLIDPTQCNNTEWLLETIIQILRNRIIVHHLLLNKIVTQWTIDSLHQTLYLYDCILDQLSLILLSRFLVLLLLLLFEVFYSDKVQHILNRNDN